MNAVVSGRAGRALIIDGEQLKSFDVDDPSTLVRRTQADIPFLLGEARDLNVLEDTSIESVERQLRADCDLALALDLVLISLDGELDEDLRTEALAGLDEMLSNKATEKQLEHVLFSSPLPPDADLKGGLAVCETQSTPLALKLLKRLETHQPSIASVDSAWQAIPLQNFNNDYDARDEFKRVAVKEGLFRDLVTVDSPAAASNFVVGARLNPSIQRLWNHRQVIQAWVTPFRQSRQTPVLVKEEDDSVLMQDRFGRRGRIDVRAVLQEANRRKSIIVEAMHRRDLSRVEGLVNELVAYQQSTGQPQYTAMSLCDLAMEAKALGMTSLQLGLTERSTNIAPGDNWSWIQHANALLRMQRLEEALKASEQAISFGGGVVAKAGKAEILKAKGRLDDALAVYDEAIIEDPENSVVKNGRAEVLEAMGRFEDALAAFDEVIARDGENVIAKNGRADVLKAQGLFGAALDAYEEIIQQHPDDVVAKNGRAEVLKAQGELAAAQVAYDETITLHPDDVVAKNGRAEVLKAQGQFTPALTAYQEIIRLQPEDIIAKNGRAEVLKAQGQFGAALAAYEETIKLHPENVVAKAGRADVLKLQGNFAAALSAYEELIGQHPENAVAKTGRADVLRAQGRFDEALAAFNLVISQHPTEQLPKTARTSVLVALNRYDEALHYVPEKPPVTLDDWINYHIRGMIMLRLGKRTEAINIFNNGAQNSPFHTTKQYFRSALALTWLQGHDFKRAGDAIDQVTSQLLQPSANVIRIHVFGAQGLRPRALDAYADLRSTPHLLNDELTQELHKRYVLGEVPTKDDEWFFEREVRILMRAAAA